ncbi:elongation factor 1-beta [Sulfodiicoccus acidiphilus]|uniref:Elongation factor 1-beta n=1 Tax=Sulfodiicoccus acidiphilus TaxID=1670455 RepID=A0A830GZI1_9CREN|nr:elongation factor 1-beta [Sulfodiicoccus acidiphilus]GGT97034.1 elongation factor 1-beta [Sulfodiicoccus acidiphilus]
MTDIMAVVKVFPEGDEVNLDKLTEEIRDKLPQGYRLVRTDKEPIAYGLNALVLFITLPEQTEGGTNPLEDTIGTIQGVSHVEVVNVTRLGF